MTRRFELSLPVPTLSLLKSQGVRDVKVAGNSRLILDFYSRSLPVPTDLLEARK